MQNPLTYYVNFYYDLDLPKTAQKSSRKLYCGIRRAHLNKSTQRISCMMVILMNPTQNCFE